MKRMIALLGCSLCSLANAADWSVVYTGESAHNLRGGIAEDDAFLGNLDMTAEWQHLDWLAPEGKLFLYVLGNHGESPSEFIGDAQVFSNIDAPKAIKLYEAWFEQPFNAGSSSVKVGLIDLNSEFDVIDTAGIFQNSSFGIGADFSQSGENGPSIFPTTSLGIRLASAFAYNTYGQCIVLDAVPGDLDNERGTHIDLNSDEGYLLSCEAGWKGEAPENTSDAAKFALGLWRYSEPVERLIDEGEEENYGAYMLGETTFWRGNERSANGFARVGIANANVNAFAHYIGAGVVLNGVFAADRNDQLGLGVASVDNSGEFRMASEAEGAALENRETTYELVYRVTATDWLALQPGFQYIENPGMSPELDNALAFALRFELSQSGEF